MDKNIVYYDLDLTLNNPLSFIICYFKLRKFILNNSIDIVHSHSRRMNSIIFALNNSGLKFAYVSTAHSVFSRLHFFGFWSKNTIAVSNKVKEYIVKHSDVNVTVIENGVIYQKPIFSKEIFRRKIKLSNSDFVLCSVGRLSDKKIKLI
jgi:hypothetical protein